MFSSSGYFRGVTCPYFASGLCERPYCHFRHVKSTPGGNTTRENSSRKITTDAGSDSIAEDGAASESGPTGQGNQSSSLLSMVGQAIKQVQRDIERDKATLSSIKIIPGQADAAVGPAAVEPGSCVYKPTPISTTSSAPVSGGLYGSRTTVPEYDPLKPRSHSAHYKPTPIKLLKKQKSATKKGSGLYVMDTSEHVNDNEYDPAMNFSTKGNGVAIKRSAGDSGKNTEVKRSKVVHKGGEADHAVFSDDETEEETKNDELVTAWPSDSQTSGNKKKVIPEDKPGVFTMDVGAILGVPLVENKNDKQSQKKMKEQTGNSRKQDVAKSHTPSTSKDSNNLEKKVDKCSSQSAKVVKSIKCDKEKGDKTKLIKQSSIKEEVASEDRNIFNLMSDALSENSNDSMNTSTPKHMKSRESNKENAKSCKKDSEKPSSSSTTKHSSSHHRSDSDQHKKHSSHKREHSSSRSSGHKSESTHRHSHSSSSKRHRTSSNSSSSSRHSNKASSSGHHSSSKSSHSSSTSSKHSSKSREHDKKSSKSQSSNTSSKSANTEHRSKADRVKGRTERSFSHADLFGEDSDASDDVMIVEPPKVHIPVVELSSSESNCEDDQPHQEVGLQQQMSAISAPTVPVDVPMSDDEEDFISDEDLENLDGDLKCEETYDECLRIFNEENTRTAKINLQPKAKVIEQEQEDPAPVIGKKRVARITEKEASYTRKAPPPRGNVRPSPSQVMHNRFLAIQKAAEEAVKQPNNSPQGKTYIAHKPPVSVLKSDLTSSDKLYTSTGSVAKGIHSLPSKRVAHIPSKETIKRPTIPADFGSKVPTAVRQRYLNLFIDEAMKIYRNEKDAFNRALEEEKIVYGRSSSKNVYLNVAVNCIKKLRAETSGGHGDKNSSPAKPGHKQFSHQALLGGKMAAKTSFTVKRSGSLPKDPGTFSLADLFNLLQKYVLSPEQLVENGFPIMSEETPGKVNINVSDSKKRICKSTNNNERLCIRCGERFLLGPEGQYLVQEECIFHWGKSWKRKIGNSIENRYTCCQEDANAPGCAISKGHVHEQNKYENLSGYMQTMPKSPPIDGVFGVYALDCEMVYTTGGVELARITVTNYKLEVVYEQLVLPDKPIIDPNTRFSGLTEEDFVGVTCTIRDVQAVLLSMFSAQTILIGHSLESDLTALRLVHQTVVDTSVVFPHRLGPPYKRALRTLTAEILQKIIQDNVGGHDSQEDANAAMELMLWKLKEDAKKSQRR